MVYSGWGSESVQDQSQLRYMDGSNMGGVNNKSTAKKNANNSDYYPTTASAPALGYPSDFQSGDLDLSSPSTYTSTNSMNNMNGVKGGKKNNGHGSTAASDAPGYPGAFPTGGMSSSSSLSSRNAMNSINDMNAAMNGKQNDYRPSPAAPAMTGYPSAFSSGGVDSNSKLSSTDTGGSSIGNMHGEKNSKKSNYYTPTASPEMMGYPDAFQSSGVDSSSTRSNTNILKKASDTKTAMNGKKSSYHEPAAAPSMARYSDGFQSSEIDSSSTSAYTNTLTNANKVNRANNGNYPASTATPPMVGYPSSFQSGEMDSSYTAAGNVTITTSNTQKKNPAKSGKKDAYHSTTETPARAAYPSTFQSSEADSTSTRANKNGVNTVSKTNNLKNGSYTLSTAEPATKGYPSTFQSSNNKSSSKPIAAAWEEHIDENTNRRYFYNVVTGRSSWGEPDATVKRPPPPPPSPPPLSPVVEKREQDQWFRIRNSRGKRVWYNEVTKRTQVDRPDCLRKYK